MTKLGLTLLLTLSTATAFAQAQPQPQPQPQPVVGFTTATTFEACTKSWAFACGKRDAQGRTFGTAHEMRHCEKYTFQPNGTYSVAERMGFMSYGTYKMIGNKVQIMPTSSDGTKGKPFELVLSTDGATLGLMKRL